MNKQKEDPEHVKSLISKTEHLIGDNILIFGASNHALVEELLKRKKKITLIDIRQSSLDNFKKYKVKLKLVKEYKEFEKLSFFHAVFFYDTLHHIKNKKKKIRECSQILEKNGRIILYEPNIHSKLEREHDQFGELKDSIYKYKLYRILKKQNFNVKLISSESLLPRKRKLKKFVIAMQNLIVDPRYRILMIARKK